MSTRSEVMLWAQRVIARKGQPAHVLLELRADCSAEDAQGAFHKIARTSHPDLHRSGLKPEELEIVTSAYAACAGAYQELRTKTMATVRMQPLRREDVAAPKTPSGGSPVATPSAPATSARPMPSPAAAPAPGPPIGTAAASTKPEAAMSPKALLYYRKAELALKRGDLKAAILQLKLACATDSTSAFLKSALAEVETEVRKTT